MQAGVCHLNDFRECMNLMTNIGSRRPRRRVLLEKFANQCRMKLTTCELIYQLICVNSHFNKLLIALDTVSSNTFRRNSVIGILRFPIQVIHYPKTDSLKKISKFKNSRIHSTHAHPPQCVSELLYCVKDPIHPQ